MLISENTLNSAYAELCLQPPHVWQWLSTTTDRSRRVSEQRGDIWVTSATFSTDHSVTHQIFYCFSHALCLSLKDRNKCQVSPSLWPSHVLGFSSSLWMHQSPTALSRADCTSRKTGFSLQLSVTYLDHRAYYHGIWMPSRKTVYDDVFHGFHCVSPSLSSLTFHFIFPAKYLLSWRPLCCSFLYSFPLTHPR